MARQQRQGKAWQGRLKGAKGKEGEGMGKGKGKAGAEGGRGKKGMEQAWG